MIKKIKALIRENKENQVKIISLSQELDWANVYHDSIRGKKWLEDLPLNIGRWAGSYSFFYLLNRILSDFKPKTILEFGLGESSKFVMAYLDNFLHDSSHLIIEQDQNWKDIFILNNVVSNKSVIQICPLVKVEIKSHQSNSYKDLSSEVNSKFDLYIIDGPFGSTRYSRYDIVHLALKFEAHDEFIIIFDDYNRLGEKDSAKDLVEILQAKGITIYKETYTGIKSVLVIVTQKYKYAISL